MRWVLLPVLLVGCAPSPEAPCEAEADPLLEVAPGDADYGAFVDGDPIPFGPPPQGGAPYTPLSMRVSGLTSLDLGITVELSAVDLDDGADLGALDHELRPFCSNVGDSAGTWVAGELHHRYFGWNLDELEGRMAAFTVRITDAEGKHLERTVEGQLEGM